MIKLDGFFLNNITAIDALNKLYSASGLPAESAYRVGRIHEAVMRHMKIVGEKAIAIHKKYCLIDPTGMPSGLSEGKLEFNEPKEQNEKDHDKEFEDLLKIEFEIKVNPVLLSSLSQLLSPKEILSLEKILVLPPDLLPEGG